MMSLTKCRTLFNGEKYVPSDTMIQRPSVYGFVIHDHQLLVAKAEYTKRYVLPGGGIHKGEAIQGALVREIREETNIEVTVGEFLHFETDFFYYDPLELAIHGFLFFYRCFPLSIELNIPDYPPDEGLEMPMWVDIAHLQADQFQTHGEITMKLVMQLIG
jgi:8-oxo-dGTP pyrophosphatase MutT (NUDIX family)